MLKMMLIYGVKFGEMLFNNGYTTQANSVADIIKGVIDYSSITSASYYINSPKNARLVFTIGNVRYLASDFIMRMDLEGLV